MTNTKISEIGWGIAAGENRRAKQRLLGENIKAGSLVFIKYSDNKIYKAANATGAMGILGKHYDVDLDTEIASGKRGRVITRGYVNIFCDDANADKEAGSYLFDQPTNAGIAPWSAGGGKLGYLVDKLPDDDEVCRIFLDRG